ncbi:hypothetical protein WDW89_22065 [Deltaproteobacteria bacterium TL4]
MNFSGHFAGGIVAGGGITLVAIASQAVVLNAETLNQLVNNPLNAHNSIVVWMGLFLTTVFMSLFPDLDTGSIPQRWFFRIVFILLIFLYFKKWMDIFAVVAFSALLPVVHKHRGWTHWKITPWLIALFLGIILEYFRAKASWFQGFSWGNVEGLLRKYWLYVVACITGHYTHLLLDSRHVKWLPFISNSREHH